MKKKNKNVCKSTQKEPVPMGKMTQKEPVPMGQKEQKGESSEKETSINRRKQYNEQSILWNNGK